MVKTSLIQNRKIMTVVEELARLDQRSDQAQKFGETGK